MEQQPAIYENAIIHTMDANRPRAEALLIRDGRIAAVGSRDEIRSAGRDARRIDLAGQAVVPGFNDAHCHILSFGLNLDGIDVSVDAVHDIAGIGRAVADRARRAGSDEWLLGSGYDQNMLAERRHPTRHDLDQASPNHPVVLHHTSGHVLTANSRALEHAGLGPDTVTPPGGEVDRDEHGVPTGVLKEAAMGLMASAIPPPTTDQGKRAIVRAMQTMASFGITSATDLATGHGPSPEPELAMYRAAVAAGEVVGRIGLCPQIEYVAAPDTGEVQGPGEFTVGQQPDWLAISATKIFSDGALSTRTAALRRPYAGEPENRGILLWATETLQIMMERAHAAGWQIATHALGDRAVEEVLACYRRVLRSAPRADHRHRIEHCMIVDEALAREMRDLGIVPVIQPDIHRLGDGYIAALGPERAAQVIPVPLFARAGLTIAFSSDAPVIPCNPLDVIRSAVVRTTPSGEVLGPDYAIDVMDGIRYYTSGSAHATHRDDLVGALRPGLAADFAVLNADPATTPREELATVRVTMTVIGGREVFA